MSSGLRALADLRLAAEWKTAAEAWAVGFTLAGPLVLQWNGTAWTRVQLPAAIGRGVLAVDGVAATSATDAWAVMRTDSGPRIAHWDGRQWADVVTLPVMPHVQIGEVLDRRGLGQGGSFAGSAMLTHASTAELSRAAKFLQCPSENATQSVARRRWPAAL